jgi:hypothetical protein
LQGARAISVSQTSLRGDAHEKPAARPGRGIDGPAEAGHCVSGLPRYIGPHIEGIGPWPRSSFAPAPTCSPKARD